MQDKNTAELNTGLCVFRSQNKKQITQKVKNLESLSAARQRGLVNVLAEVTLGKLVATGGN